MGVQFFFDNAKRKINKDFPNVFGEGRGRIGTGKGRVSTVGLYNKFIKPYGWLNSLYMVAEKGVFRVDGMNDVDSVKNRKRAIENLLFIVNGFNDLYTLLVAVFSLC